MFQVSNHKLEQDDPWSRILSVVIFPMQSTFHTYTQAMTMQLVFGHDTIINLTFDSNWHLIKQCKKNLINQSNAKENSQRVNNTYKVDDLVLIKNEQSSKYGKDAYSCNDGII